MKRQENRAVLAWRGAASAGLDSSADRAYMKAPVPRPTLQLVDKVSRSCGHTPGKVAGQRATVKAEMNGFTPGLDLRPLSRWMGGQGGQSLKVLGRSLSDFEVFSFSKLNNQNKFFSIEKKFYLLSSSMPYFFLLPNHIITDFFHHIVDTGNPTGMPLLTKPPGTMPYIVQRIPTYGDRNPYYKWT